MEISNEKINKWLFMIVLLSIFPTCFLGVLGSIDNFKKMIWVWDAVVIAIVFFISISLNKKIKKNRLYVVIYFAIVMIIQYLSYADSLEKGMIEPIYTILPIIYFTHFFSTFVMFSGLKVKRCDFSIFFKYFYIFVVIACVYNIIKNNQIMFNISKLNDRYVHISSFFSHRNAFGQFVFLGIVSNIYLLTQNKDKKLYIALAFLFINLVFSFSRTSIFTTIIFCVLFMVLNVRNKKQLIKMLILGTIILLIGLTVIINNDNFLSLLDKYIFRTSDGLSGRNKVWDVTIELLDGGKILTGYGLGSSSALLKKFNLSNSHNSYLETLIAGGGTLFLLYIICYISIFKYITKIKNKTIRNIYISFFISFLIYCFFEKVLIFSTGYAGVFFTVFLVVIPSLMAQNDINEEVKT